MVEGRDIHLWWFAELHVYLVIQVCSCMNTHMYTYTQIILVHKFKDRLLGS